MGKKQIHVQQKVFLNCFNNFSAQLSLFSVHVGDTQWNIFDKGQWVGVKEIIQHQGFNILNLDNDVSVLLLKTNLVFNDRVKSICLAYFEPNAGSLVSVIGWGTTTQDGPLSNHLQTVNVPIIDRKRCNQLHGNKITANMICAGYETGKFDSCQVKLKNLS